VAQWIFQLPPEEMGEEQLRDELADILFTPESEDGIDLDALDRVLSALDEKCPIPDLPSVEGSLAAFRGKHKDQFAQWS
jgi:hypothetical protein